MVESPSKFEFGFTVYFVQLLQVNKDHPAAALNYPGPQQDNQLLSFKAVFFVAEQVFQSGYFAKTDYIAFVICIRRLDQAADNKHLPVVQADNRIHGPFPHKGDTNPVALTKTFVDDRLLELGYHRNNAHDDLIITQNRGINLEPQP
jgi:hypothetical protein